MGGGEDGIGPVDEVVAGVGERVAKAKDGGVRFRDGEGKMEAGEEEEEEDRGIHGEGGGKAGQWLRKFGPGWGNSVL